MCLLIWYGRVYKPKPSLTYVNDFAVWIIPAKNGLSALAVLPNDNNDSNNIKTGLRIWVQPPDSVLAFERKNAARYRGKNIVAIGAALTEDLKQAMLSTIDSSGNLYWLGPLDAEQTGEDVAAELKIFNINQQDYILDLVYEGCKLRFFGSQAALDSTAEEPLSVAILMFEPLGKITDNKEMQVMIWKGKEINSDSSRIALEETMALISFNKKRGLSASKIRLKDWKP